MSDVRIGTSGWSYDHWTGLFYPEHLPADERLRHYASRFSTVEVNSTFYRLPNTKTVTAWRETVPASFVFAVKGSRFITHVRRLKDTTAEVRNFMNRVGMLGARLGVVLWQLPPFLERDVTLLARFLERLPRPPRHAIEFRNESWLHPEVFATLQRFGAAVVHVSGEQLRTDLTTTADFVYVRFHGTARYHGAYEEPQLAPWARFLGEQADAGRDAYAYFNNDAEGHAPRDAARLIGMLESRHAHAGSPPNR